MTPGLRQLAEHQYLGGVIKTWCGVTLDIDLDKLGLRLPHA